MNIPGLLSVSILAGLLATEASRAQNVEDALKSDLLNRAASTRTSPAAGEAPALSRFDFDFPGGPLGALVKAIEKASKTPLNIVIPIGSADTPLPPLKMRSVTVPELFRALEAASQSTVNGSVTTYGSTRFTSGHSLRYNFQTQDKPPRDDSVWYFSSQMIAEPKGCRFWQLAPYLETYTIDDITTAIQTGYKMLGEADSAPTMNFHKDTKLLIAVGEESKLALIDAVLQQLTPVGPGRPAAMPTPRTVGPAIPAPAKPAP
jgi:hypothetical protein